MLVNAYVLYVVVSVMEGKSRKDLLTHHDFRESIPHAWICPSQFGVGPGFGNKGKRMAPTGGGRIDTNSIYSGSRDTPCVETPPSRVTRAAKLATATSGRANKRSAYIKDKSLDSGKFAAVRLDKSHDHYPVPPSKNRSRCVIHKWVGGYDKVGAVMDCEDCCVTLCVGCFKLFHVCPNLVSRKEELAVQFAAEWKEKANKGNQGTQKK